MQLYIVEYGHKKSFMKNKINGVKKGGNSSNSYLSTSRNLKLTRENVTFLNTVLIFWF